jgi:CDGSH-type Zn-finger protein
MTPVPTIECLPNGPYLVKQLATLHNARGDAMAVQPVMALCRCGGSATKPFCDGTHQHNGFSGAKEADGHADRRDNYHGLSITIHDNRAICAHSGRCTEGLAAVFRLGAKPWIDADGAEAAAIIDTVRQCPSGALGFSLRQVEFQEQMRDPAISVTRDGPYAVVGSVELLGQSWAQGASREHYTLCRCGASRNKPFCDGAHHDIKFKDEESPAASPGEAV